MEHDLRECIFFMFIELFLAAFRLLRLTRISLNLFSTNDEKKSLILEPDPDSKTSR